MAIKMLYDYVYIYDTKNKKDPEKRYAYFYDLSDDTVFRINDKDYLERFMHSSRGHKIVSSFREESWKMIIQALLIFLPWFLWDTAFEQNARICYVYALLVSLNLYLFTIKTYTKNMKKLKLNSEVVQVIYKTDMFQEKTLTVEEVKTMTVQGIKQEELYYSFFGSFFYTILALIPFLSFFTAPFLSLVFMNPEILPHNYLRLYRHLKRIEKEDRRL